MNEKFGCLCEVVNYMGYQMLPPGGVHIHSCFNANNQVGLALFRELYCFIYLFLIFFIVFCINRTKI